MLALMAFNLAMMISMTATEILFTVADIVVAIVLLLILKADNNTFIDNDKGEEQ